MSNVIKEYATEFVLDNNEIESDRMSIPQFTAHAMVGSFMDGYARAIEGAGEGFEEYWESLEKDRDEWAYEWCRDDWQAAKLSSQKELAEKDAKILELEEKLKLAEESIEDLFLESEHITGCRYDSDGHEYPCLCMDRNYFNRDDCMDRLKEALVKIRGEQKDTDNE